MLICGLNVKESTEPYTPIFYARVTAAPANSTAEKKFKPTFAWHKSKLISSADRDLSGRMVDAKIRFRHFSFA